MLSPQLPVTPVIKRKTLFNPLHHTSFALAHIWLKRLPCESRPYLLHLGRAIEFIPKMAVLEKKLSNLPILPRGMETHVYIQLLNEAVRQQQTSSKSDRLL